MGKELFHLAATSKLRVYVAVPQVDTASAVPGTAADVTLAERPGRIYHGRLARTADSIELASRTLRVEGDVDNPDGTLLPGSYVQVHLKLPGAAHAVTVPVAATLFRSEGLNVAAVRDGHAVLIPISVGRDYGNELEVISGLSPDEELINNPPDALVNGQAVRTASNSEPSRTSEQSGDRQGAVASSSIPAPAQHPGEEAHK